MRFERRLEQPRWLHYASPFILILAALIGGALLLWLVEPIRQFVYTQMATIAWRRIWRSPILRLRQRH